MTDAIRALKVNFQACIKAGECYYNHPGLFGRTESGFPALKVSLPATPSEVREAHEAVEVCPSQAITYEDGLSEDVTGS